MDLEPEDLIVPTRFWHHLDGGRMQCDMCPRFCNLNEGHHGLCFVCTRQIAPNNGVRDAFTGNVHEADRAVAVRRADG